MRLLLVLMAQLQLWDGLITHTFVNHNLAKEVNPLMAPIVSEGYFLVLKLIGLLICIPVLWVISKRFPKLAMAAASSVVVFYSAVIVWNFSVILGM